MYLKHLEELFLWHSLTSASLAILLIVCIIDKLHKLSAIDQVSFAHLHQNFWVTDSIPRFLILLTVLLFLAGAEKPEKSSLSVKKQVSAINIDSSVILQVEVCHCKIMSWSTSGKNFILEKQSCTFRKLLNCLLFQINLTHIYRTSCFKDSKALDKKLLKAIPYFTYRSIHVYICTHFI